MRSHNQTKLGRSLAFFAAGLCLTVSLAVPAYATETDRTVFDQIDRLADHIITTLEIPGAHLSIGIHDELVYSRSFGVSDIGNATPVRSDTLFRTASVAKSITGVLLARMAQDGSINLDQSIADFHPDLARLNRKITLRLLSAHLGGIRHYQSKDSAIDATDYKTPQQILSIFISDPLVAEPGMSHKYSTFGFSLISVALELKTGKKFDQLLFDYVSKPLGLENTMPDYPNLKYRRKTNFYERNTEEGIRRAGKVVSSYKYAGGGLLSTPDDLVKIGQGLLSDQFISKDMRTIIFTPQQTSDGTKVREGLAWRIGKDYWGNQISHHAGSMNGARSVIMIYPDSGVVVALMSNLTINPYFIENVVQLITAPLIKPDLEFNKLQAKKNILETYIFDGTFIGEQVTGTAILTIEADNVAGFIEVTPAMNRITSSNGFVEMQRYPIFASDMIEDRLTAFVMTPFGIIDMPITVGDNGITMRRRLGQISIDLTLQQTE